MSSLIPSNCPEFVSQRCELYPVRRDALKRRFAHSTALGYAGTYPWLIAYPSPPMSNPPSPPRTLPFQPPSITGPTPSATSTPGSITTFVPAFATSLSSAQPGLPPTFTNQPFITAPFAWPQPPGPTGHIASYRPPPIFHGTSSSSIDAPSSSNEAGLSTRGGRRSKTHVASACVNCKRAHLSCDVQRPCTRCVSSGKQDTCVDVQHKKRGRPRLREESDPSAQQMIPEQGSPQALIAAGPSQPSMRPIAEPRRPRAESFRSLKSQASDDSGPSSIATSTPVRGGATSIFSPYSARQPPTPSTGPLAFEIATALLTTDLVIVRANRPFEHIMFGGRDVRDRNIAELASPADGEGFQSIRNRLRAEREAREPAYMPPMVQPGHDPLLRISEVEVEQYTQGFNVHTYTWRQTQLGPVAETFPARVRLAKASAYFIVVTLPSFHPVEQPPAPIPQPPPFSYGPPLMLGPPLGSPEPLLPSREQTMHSAPPMTPFALQGPGPPMPPQYRPSYTYPPPAQPLGFFQQQGYPRYQLAAPTTTTPRLPPSLPPSETAAFTPRPALLGPAQPLGTAALQLPPLAAGAPIRVAGAPLSSGQPVEESSEEDEEEGGSGLRSSRKRRRMGIDDVLSR
ncbi:hypothetical protein LTR74_002950 [Friedmanniomyces endolithicus]|nr:hypothetical protein LTR74_002950 [Friedmanniomyces endolithicus]